MYAIGHGSVSAQIRVRLEIASPDPFPKRFPAESIRPDPSRLDIPPHPSTDWKLPRAYPVSGNGNSRIVFVGRTGTIADRLVSPPRRVEG
ncbi:hypothetical protein Ddc_21029 [Ditylenchus destructor]|nr:hypothetical protein Ddc_21029 [Ditylenchus destructor]